MGVRDRVATVPTDAAKWPAWWARASRPNSPTSFLCFQSCHCLWGQSPPQAWLTDVSPPASPSHHMGPTQRGGLEAPLLALAPRGRKASPLHPGPTEGFPQALSDLPLDPSSACLPVFPIRSNLPYTQSLPTWFVGQRRGKPVIRLSDQQSEVP
jgi:hypothetical protein